MKQPIFELYDPTNDQTIKIYDNGKVEYSDKDIMYTCITNRIPEKEIEVHNEAIEAAANLLDKEHEIEPEHIPVRITTVLNEIRKLKK